MNLSRRQFLLVVGGGAVVSAAGLLGFEVTRTPETAYRPWDLAGTYSEPRMRALSWALLAPNPHNRQPWWVDLTEEGAITLLADPNRLLPHTDPFGRQITIGLGCFLELLRMAAAEDGYRVETTLFPLGSSAEALDQRPIARIVMSPDPSVSRDPLFAFTLSRRSNKDPYDTSRTVPPELLTPLASAVRNGARFGGTVDPAQVNEWGRVARESLRIEFETPRTYRESVDLYRIGRREVDANPDGITFVGPLFEALRIAGQFTREAAIDPSGALFQQGLDFGFAQADTAGGFVWLVTDDNRRDTQIATGADWLRVNLAATAAGLAFQPMSQALQEFPEMAGPYRQVHDRLAPNGGTVQMLARIGYAPSVRRSPRWSLDTRVIGAEGGRRTLGRRGHEAT